MDEKKIEKAVVLMLEAMGEEVEREGLKDTPARVARAFCEIFAGYEDSAKKHLSVTFAAEGSGIVVEKDIAVYSVCEHHLLPFFGRAHVAYIPRAGRITGLSKIARCVSGFAHRMQLQERLTAQIADALMAELEPLGVLVVLEAEHTCMTMRGVRAAGALTVTSAVRGGFKNDIKTREEALRLIGLNG